MITLIVLSIISFNEDQNKGKEEPNYRIFAITKQSDNFNKLISDDILGIADLDILSTSDAKIVHIQVEPELV